MITYDKDPSSHISALKAPDRTIRAYFVKYMLPPGLENGIWSSAEWFDDARDMTVLDQVFT